MEQDELDIDTIRKNFDSYLDKFRKLSDIEPYLLSYIRLLLLFKHELSQAQLNAVLERQKQLREGQLQNAGFEDLLNSSRREMNQNLGNNTSMTRTAMLNRLLFDALLDTAENDFFYITEPMFEFVWDMEVSSDEFKQILEAEFVGFEVG